MNSLSLLLPESVQLSIVHRPIFAETCAVLLLNEITNTNSRGKYNEINRRKVIFNQNIKWNVYGAFSENMEQAEERRRSHIIVEWDAMDYTFWCNKNESAVATFEIAPYLYLLFVTTKQTYVYITKHMANLWAIHWTSIFVYHHILEEMRTPLCAVVSNQFATLDLLDFAVLGGHSMHFHFHNWNNGRE